jgi:Spy/CpxP family protein refolding chaperone
MLYLRLAVVMVAVALLGAAAFQEKDKDKGKKDDKTPAKLKGTLPMHYKQVGLSADQVQKIYKIQADYKDKLEDLKKKMDQLKSDQKDAMEKVLTPDQLKKLKALRAGEKPPEK